MQRVFIVRPFGKKRDVDFDAIERDLIKPALDKAGLLGNTTTEIFEAGNIREDMFRLLVTADVVLADVSMHNANVFYELGIRHGIRPRATFLINSKIDDFPFDLQTDRYLQYDRANPAASVEALAQGLKATVDGQRPDSPVYRVLPELKSPDPAVLKVVPSDFREAVDRACKSKERGDLRLLAHEARTFEWASEGLRVVGRAQFDVAAWAGAVESFEWLRELQPDDVEANQRLGTCYQRLGDLIRANESIARVIQSKDAARGQRAEALALHARNVKALWLSDYRKAALAECPVEALRSPRLAESIDNYASGFSLDLNHFYSGLNAMSLLRIRIGLAEALAAIWSDGFDADDDASRALRDMKRQFDLLEGAVGIALKAAVEQAKHVGQALDEWTRISEADYAFLTAMRPTAVGQRYRAATAGVSEFARASARAQLRIFTELGVRTEFAEEGLRNIEEPPPAEPPGARARRALVFTGHMVDAPGRKTPRFPNTQAAETQARRLIHEAVTKEAEAATEGLIGIAGGACGGDILFHEVCEALGIETRLLLALPATMFCASSVEHGGPDWVERYNRLCERKQARVLSEEKELPRWLRSKAAYSIWQRNNLWILFNALSLNSRNLTLIALWDGGPADGPGGTEDLVQQVKARGHKNIILPAGNLKEFAG